MKFLFFLVFASSLANASVQQIGGGITAITGDVTATGSGSVSATVATVGGSTASNIHTAEVAANAASSADSASTILIRDSFSRAQLNLPNTGVEIKENFMATTAVGNSGWGSSSSGTGSGTGVETTPIVSANHQGVVGCYTGSTTTGRCSMVLAQQTILGGGQLIAEAMIDIPTLSVVSDEYIFRSGLLDVGTGAPGAGLWFSYDRLNKGVNWQCNSAHASTTSTTDTGLAVSTGWHKLKLIVNAAGTSADYYVDGTKYCTMTTNFPTSSDLLGNYPNGIFKSAGTTNTSTKIDYYYYSVEFTTPI